MKTASIFVLLGASMAAAETCSGFESRLNALAAQVQSMIDIVDGMSPNNYPQCGGIVGGKIDVGTLLTSIPTGPTSVNPTRRYDHQWCCEQCIEYAGCTFWSLQMRGGNVSDESKMRCQLYAENWDVASRADMGVANGSPGGFIFPVGLGVGLPNDGSKRVSGIVPEMGRWGGSTDASSEAALKNPNNYMVDTELNGAAGTATLMWNNVTGDPNAPMAEGFELCDSLGAFKPPGLGGTGNPVITYARHPLECCSLCSRTADMDGNYLATPCKMWSYNYDPKKRQCVTRDTSYTGFLDEFGVYQDPDMQVGRDNFQANSVCAAEDNQGVQRYYPDGTTACAGGFPARRWSSGSSNERSMDELEYLVTGV